MRGNLLNTGLFSSLTNNNWNIENIQCWVGMDNIHKVKTRLLLAITHYSEFFQTQLHTLSISNGSWFQLTVHPRLFYVLSDNDRKMHVICQLYYTQEISLNYHGEIQYANRHIFLDNRYAHSAHLLTCTQRDTNIQSCWCIYPFAHTVE